VRKYIWLIALLGVSQVADITSTLLAMSHGLHETNPIAVALGFPALVAMKLGFVVLAYFLLRFALRFGRAYPTRVALVGVTAFTFMVAGLNVLQVAV
jgi:hypothetical protein